MIEIDAMGLECPQPVIKAKQAMNENTKKEDILVRVDNEVAVQNLTKLGKQIEKVIALNVPDKDIIERITGRRTSKVTGKIYHIKFNPPVDEKEEDLVQRADDTEEVVVKRLETYHNQTAPVLDYYKAQNKVTEIDGTKKLEDITQDIFKILG